jgi:hypothetical protein
MAEVRAGDSPETGATSADAAFPAGAPSPAAPDEGHCGGILAPGQVATWATAKEDEVDAFGFGWSRPGRSSKHFPFDWSGPDGG